MVDLSGIAALDHKAHERPRFFGYQVVVDCSGGEQGGNWSHVDIGATVADDDHVGTAADCLRCLDCQTFERSGEAGTTVLDRVAGIEHRRLEVRGVSRTVESDDRGQLRLG